MSNRPLGGFTTALSSYKPSLIPISEARFPHLGVLHSGQTCAPILMAPQSLSSWFCNTMSATWPVVAQL